MLYTRYSILFLNEIDRRIPEMCGGDRARHRQHRKSLACEIPYHKRGAASEMHMVDGPEHTLYSIVYYMQSDDDGTLYNCNVNTI